VTSVVSAATAGVAAGLAVAVPLGAVSVLLVSEGMARGWRSAAAAASGIATVDVLYAAAAGVAGAAVSAALAGRETAVRMAAAAVLAAVAVRGLRGARETSSTLAVVPGGEPGGQVWARSYWRFVALTAVNPLTAVYFVALAAGLGDRLAGPALAAFVAGVGAGSLAWQLLLAGLGAGAGTAVGPRGRRWTSVAGNVTVLCLAIAVALGPVVAGS
jgi:threonine/homoserine/homoserine lactone efflux protein